MSGGISIMDLFRDEVRTHGASLSDGLLALEQAPGAAAQIEPLMRAAHSLKGAARIVGIDLAVELAHDMEEVFVAAQAGRLQLAAPGIDLLLRASDLLAELASVKDDGLAAWAEQQKSAVAGLREELQALRTGRAEPRKSPEAVPPPAPARAEPRKEPVEIPVTFEAESGDNPLLELYREEVAAHAGALQQGLEELAKSPGNEAWLETLLHAAHAIRSAALIVGMAPAASLAAALESLLGAARESHHHLSSDELAQLQQAMKVLASLTPADMSSAAVAESEMRALLERLRTEPQLPTAPAPPQTTLVAVAAAEIVAPAPTSAVAQPAEAVVRVTAQSLNQLMSLAGESLVQARWLQPFATALLKLKKHQDHLAELLESLSQAVTGAGRDRAHELAAAALQQMEQCRHVLAERSVEFENHAAQAENLNSRLYDEVISSRMRPFADGAHGFPRLVRDMARKLDKQVRLDLVGRDTPVDRDILEKLEAPLTHLLRNAVDHGIEPPTRRQQTGKAEQGTITVTARHRAGMLAIDVADDGAGIDLDRLRRKIVERGLSAAGLVETMSEAELLEFLFLPGFSTAPALTEYSGRGVGLDVVHTMLGQVGGTVRISTRPGQGTTFHLQLPLTLSVVRAVLVDIAGEPYAFPHNRINRLLRLPLAEVRSLEGRQFATVDGQEVGLVVAAQLFDQAAAPAAASELVVLLLSDVSGSYGLIVDSLRGEQDLVVRALDPRVGKVPNISAAAILDDGSPVLIADVEDMARSMDQFIRTGTLRRLRSAGPAEAPRRRVLVVDDSITVRETERQLLRERGYDVAVAVDGQEGWNVLQTEPFDLVVTDIDMPRMNGLDLVDAMRRHEAWRKVPVIIISYKDREEDRLRGLEVGANYYLTKSSFHDNTFLQAVADLIGEPGGPTDARGDRQ
jgi:two-component system sensor histidine kinase and response regulator WspE